MVQPNGEILPPFEDIREFTPEVGSLNFPGGPAVIAGQYSAQNIVDEINATSPGLPVVVSQDAGGYVCDAATYHLNRIDSSGEIDLGAFFHVPETATIPQHQAFAEGVVNSLFGANSDPDGDGRINVEDSFPFNDQLN